MKPSRTIIFFGGNGHCSVRLSLAREAIAKRVEGGQPAPQIAEIKYPGFEGRPRAPDLSAFLLGIENQIRALDQAPSLLIYGTGIGGLLALALRARGSCGSPLLLQAPILWGLEHRWMPRLMRLTPAQALFRRLVGSGWFQQWFERRQFESALQPDLRRDFFDGYRRCLALTDLFAWLNPAWLRTLEAGFRAHPAALDRITIWWGGRDRVVSPIELEWTEEALEVRWPRRVFPEWGHYPMIEEPYGWIQALNEVARE